MPAVRSEPLCNCVEEPGSKSEGHGGRAHRHAGVAAIRVLDCIPREDEDGVDALIFKFPRRSSDEKSIS